MKKTMILFLLLIHYSCTKNRAVDFENCIDCPEIVSGHDGLKNFIKFRYSHYDTIKFTTQIMDSSYVMLHDSFQFSFLEFNRDEFKTKVIENQIDGSLKFVDKTCRKIKFECKDSKYKNLTLFSIDKYLITEDFGSLNLLILCDFNKGILSTFLSSDTFDTIPNVKFKPKINAIRGYSPDCIRIDSLFQKVKFI